MQTEPTLPYDAVASLMKSVTSSSTKFYRVKIRSIRSHKAFSIENQYSINFPNQNKLISQKNEQVDTQQTLDSFCKTSMMVSGSSPMETECHNR